MNEAIAGCCVCLILVGNTRTMQLLAGRRRQWLIFNDEKSKREWHFGWANSFLSAVDASTVFFRFFRFSIQNANWTHLSIFRVRCDAMMKATSIKLTQPNVCTYSLLANVDSHDATRYYFAISKFNQFSCLSIFAALSLSLSAFFRLGSSWSLVMLVRRLLIDF